MERNWWLKVILTLGLILASVVMLIPTILGDDTPDWFKSITDKRINLGLDLRGGIHLVLGVEVEKAVADYVYRLTEEVDQFCEEEDLRCEKISNEDGKPILYVTFANETDLTGAKDELVRYLGNMNVIDAPEDKVNTLAFEIQDDFAKHRKQTAVLQAIETLRNRIDEMSVREALVARQGETSILIQIPGIKDVERARKMIGQTAQLEFKIVDDTHTGLTQYKDEVPAPWTMEFETNTDKNGNMTQSPYLSGPKDDAGDNLRQIREWLVGKVDSEHEVLFEEYEDSKKLETRWRSYTLIKRTMLTGDTITDARVSIDQQQNRPYVSMNFDRQGARQFGKVTGEHVKERLAIVLDNRVKSAPVIQSAITGGRAQITLNALKSYNELFEEAQDLSIVLRAGALPAPVRFEENRTVGPTLGKDSIESGQRSIIVGFIIVVIFMLMYYRMSGMIANSALFLNLLFIMAVMAAFGATLTLPGLAGIVLTIGMAVDANVIIFERIREESRIGKTKKAAIDSGYGKAFWTIFDANITTAIAGFVLWSYGTGPVKGFAVTLLVGIACSMFTAIFVTRLVFDLVTEKSKSESLSI
jgi:preprotein translocase subunit SecD